MKGKKPKQGKRPGISRAEALRVEQRITDIVRIRLDGAQFYDVREFVREAEQEDGSPWKLGSRDKPLSDGQLRRYVRRADDRIQRIGKGKRSRLIHRHLARREHLYGKAVNAGDVGAALAILKDMAMLRGLYPQQTLKLKGSGKGGSIPVTFEHDYDSLKKLPLDELVRLHRQTLELPAAGGPDGPGSPP